MDDVWASTGSDNFNRRSWTHDSEMSAVVCHPGYARDLRLELGREHLETEDDSPLEPGVVFDSFAASAEALQRWHLGGRSGPRPPGRLRPLEEQHPVTGFTKVWAGVVYRVSYDPDGAPEQVLMRGWVPVSSALAPVALIGGWTVAAARQGDGFDSVRDTISALAAHGADDRWVMTAGLAVLGRWVLGAGGVSAALVAVFAQPSAGHFPVATASFLALTLWPAASGVPSRRAGLAATVGLGALLVWFGTQLGDGDLLGLSERVVAGSQALWPLAVVLVLRRRERRTTGEAG